MTLEEANRLAQNYRYIAGVDEAGRGPLAGPVITAAVILDPERPIDGLADSKQLTQARREALAEDIKSDALAWATGRAEVEEIDRLNILQATLLAMRRAVVALEPAPQLALVDGNQLPQLPCKGITIIRGDMYVAQISAASILAKVTRDAEMRQLDSRFPEYGFSRHKGYPTAAHMQALETYGVSAVHRRSFGPVRKRLQQS